MYEINHMPREIEIGFIGETNFRPIEINMSEWMKKAPGGVPSIVCIRPQETEEDAYIAATTIDENNILRWTPTEGDLGIHEGYGEIQIWLEKEVNGTVQKRGKSVRVKTRVNYAIASASAQVPAGQQAWMEQMTALKDIVVDAAAGIAGNVQSAAESAQQAADSQSAAEGSASAAAESARQAAASQSAAAGSASAALESARQAAASQSEAAGSASTALSGAERAESASSTAVSAAGAAASSASQAASDQSAAQAARAGAESAQSNAQSAASAAGTSASNANQSASAAATSAGEAAQSASNATAQADAALAAKTDTLTAKQETLDAIAAAPEMLYDTANYFVLCHASVNPVLTTLPSETIEVDGATHTVYPFALCAETEKDYSSEWDTLRDDDFIAFKPIADYVVQQNRYYPDTSDDIAPYMNVYLFYRTTSSPARPGTGRRVFIRVRNMSRMQYPVGTKLFEKDHLYLFRFTTEQDELSSRKQVDILDWNTAQNTIAKEVSTDAALKAEGYAVGKQDGVDVTSDSEYFENNAKHQLELTRQVKEEAETLVGDLAKEATLQEVESEAQQSVELLEQILAEGHSSGDLNGYSLAPGAGNEVILTYTDPETEEASSVIMITNTTGQAIAEALEEEMLMWKELVENVS